MMFRQASKRFSTAAGAAQNLTNRLNGIFILPSFEVSFQEFRVTF